MFQLVAAPRRGRWRLAAVSGFLLVCLSACLLLNASRRPAEPDLTLVPEPDWGTAAEIARRHVSEVRRLCDRIQVTSRVTALQKGRAFGELGRVFLAYDLPLPAVVSFRNAEQLDSGEFRWPYLQAISCFRSGDVASAVAAMTRALELMPQDAAATADDRLAALCFLGDAAVRLNQRDLASRVFDEALQLRPECVFALFRRGQLRAQEGNAPGAVSDFQAALTASTGQPPLAIRQSLASEYRKLGRHRDAVECVTAEDLQQRPTPVEYPNPLYLEVRRLNRSASQVNQRADQLIARGDFAAASTLLREGLLTAPESLSMRMKYADLLVKQEKFDEARSELEDVRRRDPQGRVGRGMLSQVYARIPAMREQAVAEALAWRDASPGRLGPQLTLAAVHFQLQRFDEARQCYADAAKLAPEDAAPRIGEVLALCASGEYQVARRKYEETIQDLPHNPDLQLNFARFLITCPEVTARDPDRGQRLLEPLTAEAENNAVRETLACGLAATGAYAEAAKILRAVTDNSGERELPATRRRQLAVLRSFEAEQVWTERWPFAEISTAGDSTTQSRAP